MNYRAFLDTNVLVPIEVTDLILRCAEKGLFAPLWPEGVIGELRRVLPRAHPDLDPARLQRRIDFMLAAFPESLVPDADHLIERFQAIPDPHDRPICAAASAAHADVIVTWNLRHFPDSVLGPHDLVAQLPDDFMLDQWELRPSCPRFIAGVIESIGQTSGHDWRHTIMRLRRQRLEGFASAFVEWHFDS